MTLIFGPYLPTVSSDRPEEWRLKLLKERLKLPENWRIDLKPSWIKVYDGENKLIMAIEWIKEEKS